MHVTPPPPPSKTKQNGPQVEILKRLDHPNVVTIHQFYRKDPTNFFVVLESLSGGELFDRIVKKVLCALLLDFLVTAWLTCLLACLPTCSLAGCVGCCTCVFCL